MLFNGEFDAYFSKARAGAGLWLMVHVPKTAGSSLSSDIGKHMVPRYNISHKQGDMALGHRQRFDAAVNGFLEKHKTKHFRFAAGHINGDQAEHIRSALPGVRTFAMFRHPVARFVSDYRYQRSPMHPVAAAFKLRYPDFHSFAIKKVANNKISAHLVPREIFRKGDPALCIDFIARHYTFVGFQEDYETSFTALGSLMGFKGQPSARHRENIPTTENAITLTPELRAIIEANNALDMAVFSAFQAKFDRISRDLRSYLAEA